MGYQLDIENSGSQSVMNCAVRACPDLPASTIVGPARVSNPPFKARIHSRHGTTLAVFAPLELDIYHLRRDLE